MLNTKIGNFIAFINGSSKKLGFNSIILGVEGSNDSFQILVYQTYGANACFENEIKLNLTNVIIYRVKFNQSSKLFVNLNTIQNSSSENTNEFEYFDFKELCHLYYKKRNSNVILEYVDFHEELQLVFVPSLLICYSTDYLDVTQNDSIGYIDYYQFEQTFRSFQNNCDITSPLTFQAVFDNANYYSLGPKHSREDNTNLRLLNFIQDNNYLNLPIIKLNQTFHEQLGLDALITYLTDKICKQNNHLETTFTDNSDTIYNSYKYEIALEEKCKCNTGFHNYLASKELGILNLLKVVNGDFYQQLKRDLQSKKVDILSSNEYITLTRLIYLIHDLQFNPIFVAAVLVNIEPLFKDIFKKYLSPSVYKLMLKLSVNATEELSKFANSQEVFINKLQRDYQDLHSINTSGFSPEPLIEFNPTLTIFNEQTIAQSLKDTYGFNTRVSRKLLRQYQFSWSKVKDFFNIHKKPIIFSSNDNSWITHKLPTYCLEILAYQKHCFRANNPFNTFREVYKQSFENFFKNFNERGKRGELQTYEDFVLLLNQQYLISNNEELKLALATRYSNKNEFNALNFVSHLKKSFEDFRKQLLDANYTLQKICPIEYSLEPQYGLIKTNFVNIFSYPRLSYVSKYNKSSLVEASAQGSINNTFKEKFELSIKENKKKIPVTYFQKYIDNIAIITYNRCVNNISFNYQIYIHPEAIRNFKIDNYQFSFLFSRNGKAIQAKYDFDAFVSLSPMLYSPRSYSDYNDPISNDLKAIQIRLIGKALQETLEFSPSSALYDCSPILPRINDFFNHNPYFGLSKAQSQLAINYTIYQFVME